ncbi:Ff.00g064730.m01.CDS01 [Fusarium sp. VM40]|nr:Ff.00g064730.m01.CDS01 [Fusarium sp. VM40]
MYRTKEAVSSWLDEIPLIPCSFLPSLVAAEQQVRHRNKRRKLDVRSDKLPSPPISEPVVSSKHDMNPSTPNASTKKRFREDDEQDANVLNLQDDTTPRPSRPQDDPVHSSLEWEPFSVPFGRAHSQTSSSQVSSSSITSGSIPRLKKPKPVSNRTSPTRQMRNAELAETGFNTDSLRSNMCPPKLKALWEELDTISQCSGILPITLEAKWKEAGARIPVYSFDRSEPPQETSTQLPDFEWVRHLYQRAKDCRFNRESELSWNGDVHAPILEHIFRTGRFKSKGLVDFRWAQSAQIIADFKPKDAPAKMVDFCVLYEPERGSDEEKAIETTSSTRPGRSINHTDSSRDLCQRPIALSIETKRPHMEGDSATLQISTWHSAQWRSLRYGPATTTRTIEFLPGIIVQGHEWRFVASVLDSNNKSWLLEEVRLGGTDSEIGIYALVLTLQRLRKWMIEDYWPTFKADILGIGTTSLQSG